MKKKDLLLKDFEKNKLKKSSLENITGGLGDYTLRWYCTQLDNIGSDDFRSLDEAGDPKADETFSH